MSKLGPNTFDFLQEVSRLKFQWMYTSHALHAFLNMWHALREYQEKMRWRSIHPSLLDETEVLIYSSLPNFSIILWVNTSLRHRIASVHIFDGPSRSFISPWIAIMYNGEGVIICSRYKAANNWLVSTCWWSTLTGNIKHKPKSSSDATNTPQYTYLVCAMFIERSTRYWSGIVPKTLTDQESRWLVRKRLSWFRPWHMKNGILSE